MSLTPVSFEFWCPKLCSILRLSYYLNSSIVLIIPVRSWLDLSLLLLGQLQPKKQTRLCNWGV